MQGLQTNLPKKNGFKQVKARWWSRREFKQVFCGERGSSSSKQQRMCERRRLLLLRSSSVSLLDQVLLAQSSEKDRREKELRQEGKTKRACRFYSLKVSCRKK